MKESKFQLIFIKFLIISEICFFVLGISSELISTQEFWIFSNSFSILGAIELFYKEKEYTLFFLILLFGVSAPLLKMILKLLNFTSIVGILHRFTFLDIFLVSIFIYVAKSSRVLDANLEIGFFFLISSLALSYLQMSMIFFSNKQNINNDKNEALKNL